MDAKKVIEALKDDALTTGEIAEKMKMPPTLLEGILEGLEEKGKAVRSESGQPSDRWVWELTHLGTLDLPRPPKEQGQGIQKPPEVIPATTRATVSPVPLENAAGTPSGEIDLTPFGAGGSPPVTTEPVPEKPESSVGANPRVEDGHITIAREVAEALGKVNLSPYESRILWTILYKGDDHISLRELGRVTGLHFANVKRSLAKLKAKNIIVRKDYKGIPCYRFEKDSKKWRAVVKRDYTELRFEDKKLTSVV